MRGKCVHRWLGLGILTVVAALFVSSVAQAAGAPRPPLTGVHAALEAKGPFGSEPDAVERAVLRSQATGGVATDSHQRTTSTRQPAQMPDAVERAVLRSQATGGVATAGQQRTTFASRSASLHYSPIGTTLTREQLEPREPSFVPGWAIGAYNKSLELKQQSGYSPAAQKAMGDRWAAYADRFSGSADERTAAGRSTAGFVPGWAIGAYNRSLIEKTGYTPEAIQAMGERWRGYAAQFDGNGGSEPISDANNRVDLPVTALTATVSDDSAFNWTDVAFGALLGIALVGLGGLAALAMRSHGRVPQA